MSSPYVREWECYYCEKGKVATLPAACPNCGLKLRQEWDKMTETEKWEALVRKTCGETPPMFMLAS